MLDPRLHRLAIREANREELALPVRRFREYRNEPTALSAIQNAAKELIAQYSASNSSIDRISVTALCVMCGLRLEGAPRTRSSRPAATMRTAQDAHTGKLILNTVAPTISLPAGIDVSLARVAVAHEIGHFLIHRRGTSLDRLTVRLPTSADEEALAEYCARLLLMPAIVRHADSKISVLKCLALARAADVTLHSAASRLGDPDVMQKQNIECVIYWRLKTSTTTQTRRLSPSWHLCPTAFIPINRCYASRASLVAEIGEGESLAEGSRVEQVQIGTLRGTYLVEAVAWGSVRKGTRTVLSAFTRADELK